MTHIETYQRPSSIEQAWSLLNEGGKQAKLVGGGVDVALFVSPTVTTLIDLSSIANASIERRTDGLSIGASATLTEILESPVAQDYLKNILGTVLQRVASPLLRNAATMGGALASTHPWSDVITLFLALDAQVTRYAGTWQTVSLAEALEQRGTIDRSILTEVLLPEFPMQTVVSFEKFVRAGFDVATLNCACRATMVGQECHDARVVFGGTPGIGHREEAVEALLNGETLDAARIEAAADAASEAVPARDDLRASGAYRRVLAAAGLRRCLRRIAQRAGE